MNNSQKIKDAIVKLKTQGLTNKDIIDLIKSDGREAVLELAD